MIRLLAPALALACGLAAQTIANVNDPNSPGTLGDGLLSLDEAIRVVNGQLGVGQLSAAERARLTGSGVATTVRIDAGVTPVVSLQQDPTPLDGSAPGLDLAIHGVNGRPVIDATAFLTFALCLRSNQCDVTDLVIRGGNDGIIADSSVFFAMGRPLRVERVEFEGQASAGIRLATAPGSSVEMPALVARCVFRSLANAIAIDDGANGGAVMADVEFVWFEGVQRCVDLFVDGVGSMTFCRLWRCKMPFGGQIAREQRGIGSDKRLMLMVVASEFATGGNAVEAVGTPLVETAIHVHHSTIRPAPGKHAFRCGSQDARIDWHLSENVVHGDIRVVEGRLNRRLWAWNNVFRDGTFEVDNRGTPTSFRWNRFERMTIRALPANVTQMKHSSSEFVGCTVDGQATLGDVLLENCWLSGTTLVGNTAQQSPAPSPWLATTSTSTETPSVGGSVDLTLDLPPGMLGVWDLGLPNARVVLTQEPWREYALPSVHVLLPGIHAFRTTVRLSLPNDPRLVGAQVYCTATTVPYFGQTHVPSFNLPRGVYLTIVP
jgi:hypothetical protein